MPAMHKKDLAMGAAGLKGIVGVSYLVVPLIKAASVTLAVVLSYIPSLPS